MLLMNLHRQQCDQMLELKVAQLNPKLPANKGAKEVFTYKERFVQ